MRELNPCPFCGSDDLAPNEYDHRLMCIVVCRECGAHSNGAETRANAFARWNRRPVPADAERAREKLWDAIHDLRQAASDEQVAKEQAIVDAAIDALLTAARSGPTREDYHALARLALGILLELRRKCKNKEHAEQETELRAIIARYAPKEDA